MEKVIAYAVLGGIPHYLKQFSQSLSLQDNIKQNVLQRGCILYSEVEFLMRQELRETTVYNTILEAVALGNTKLNDIHRKTLIDKSKLTVYLKNLIDLGIIRREFPISDGLKEQANIQRGLYQITDNFFRFWYAFVFPNISELEEGDVDGIFEFAVQPMLEHYTSRIFEKICHEYLRRNNRRNKLAFRFTKIGRWWDKSNELDFMATDRDKHNYLLGECKFKNATLDLTEMNATLSKFQPKKKAARLYYCLFSRSGLTEAVRAAAKEHEIQLVTLDDLFVEID